MKLDSTNIHTLKNRELAEYAARYVKIDDAFRRAVTEQGLRFGQNRSVQRNELLRELKKNGVQFRNGGKSMFINRISKACLDCRTGEGANTFILSLACNRDCFFCSNKNQFNYALQQSQLNDIIDEYNNYKRTQKEIRSVAITGGEPLLFPDECTAFFRHVKSECQSIHTRLYTNGDLIKEKILSGLKGYLDEIRVSIRYENNQFDTDAIQQTLNLCKRYVQDVTVEMPVLPDNLDEMKVLLSALNDIDIFSVNLLEFLFPWQNTEAYRQKDYRIKHRPYEVLYRYNYAGGLPVDGSEIAILQCLQYALQKNFTIGVHYCSLENKLTNQIFSQNQGIKLTPLEKWSRHDFFIKTTKAFGDDAKRAQQVLVDAGVDKFDFITQGDYLEFNLEDVCHLIGSGIDELGLSYQVVENNNQQKFLREIQIDVLTPEEIQRQHIEGKVYEE